MKLFPATAAKAAPVSRMTLTAQQELTRLEKYNAPIEAQVQQAAIFAGFEQSHLADQSGGEIGKTSESRSAYHGRQEYVLRWLLKKWSADGDNGQEARQCPNAWKLFTRCLEHVPVRSSAHILQERKFGRSVTKSVEEGLENAGRTMPQTSSGEAEKHTKKRKHDGTPVDVEPVISNHTVQLRHQIYETIARVVLLSKPADGESNAFEAEYMRSVIRMASEEAAKILGAWLNWMMVPWPSATDMYSKNWLDSFVEIWTAHAPETEDVNIFSKHCLRPILRILSIPDLDTQLKEILERLLARNVIVPCKSAYDTSSNSPLLRTLVAEILSDEPPLAPVLFNISVRCIQPQGSRRRKLTETAWLQMVFATCTDSIALPPADTANLSKANTSLSILLRSAIDFHVILDLPLLRSILSQAAFRTDYTDWSIVATIMSLDSNVFLIPDPEIDLLQNLLNRITNTIFKDSQGVLQHQLSRDIVVPLMGEFARARDLTGFMHHWYDQLKQFEDLRSNRNAMSHNIPDLCVWEENCLQNKLKELMELSLTTQQIADLVNWLEDKLGECSSAVYVISDAIAVATSNDETIEVVAELLTTLSLNVELFKTMDERYRARPWRIAQKCLNLAFNDEDPEWALFFGGELLTILKMYMGSKEQQALTHTFPDIIRCFCAAWSVGLFGIANPLLGVSTRVQSEWLISFIGILKLDWMASDPLKNDRNRGVEFKRMQYSCRALAQCICVDYPKVLEPLLQTTEVNGKKVIKNIIWLASATTPFSQESSPVPWIRNNYDIFPSIVRNMLSNETVLNNPKIIGPVIDSLLECGDHVDNPIEIARACNGFVVNCLLQLPIEVFSKSNRETILKAWPPASPDPAHNDREASSYRMASLDPAVLSLKAKMMSLPTLYKGIKFLEIVDLAESVTTLGTKPKFLLPVFSELAKLTVGHVLATVEQPKSKEYFDSMVLTIGEWIDKYHESKSVPPFAMIRLAQVVLFALISKAELLDRMGCLQKSWSEATVTRYRKLLLSTLQRRLQKPESLENEEDSRTMAVSCSLDALDTIGIFSMPSDTIVATITASIAALNLTNPPLSARLQTFLLESKALDVDPLDALATGAITSIAGRQSIQRRVAAVAKDLSEREKLHLLNTFLQNSFRGSETLNMLLALWHSVSTCEDSRETSVRQGEDDATISLSSAYSTLADQLRKVNSARQFGLISETMEMMLRSKPHSISQYNIDMTLSSIVTMCTRLAPSLPVHRAGAIYIHLTRLLQAILTSHRLKLRGRYHVLLQALTSLLRTLFITLPAITNYSHPPPPWLPGTSAPLKYHLGVPHALAFTRLLTLICSPTLSAVSHASSTGTGTLLHNPTAKAKRLAAQHMPILISQYVQMQLDMNLRMKAEVREALVPGVYVVFDTMGKEERRALGESMDAAGRAVLGTMVKDWVRWGKWKGN